MGEHEISQVFGDSRRKSHDVMIYHDVNVFFTLFFCVLYF